MTDKPDKGLREIVAAQTQISDIDGTQGRLWYVGFPIEELAEHATYEEVVHLLHNLRLPTQTELDDVVAFMVEQRDPSRFIRDLMPTLAQQTSPMSMLRTTVSAASAYDPDGWDTSPEANARKALRLIARTPTFLAMYHRLRTNQETVDPSPKLGHAANFLYMLTGVEPSPEDADTLDTTFTLYADHTMNASTFTARIIASTLADIHSAITGAIAALKGPLHGGANEESMKMLEEVGSPERAEAYIRDRLDRKQKIMGFGHAVYRTMDPRARILKKMAKDTGERHGDLRWYEISQALEEVALREKGLNPNVDFYAASVYHMLGIPTDLMTPIFAIARMAGWTAHVREQYADNRVIRPDSEYVGPRDQTWTPIEQRA
ncbi:MAG TPA: citrate/2-methylcitrate synthase [Actinomycetota bacterium]|nr:citrate/2-methylcitrate synthase [Actinomycetota bacterium]